MKVNLKDNLEWYSENDTSNSEIMDIMEEMRPKEQLQKLLDKLTKQWWLQDSNISLLR